MSAAGATSLTLRTDLNVDVAYPVRQRLGEVLGTSLIPVNPLLDMIASYLIPSLYTRLTHGEVITTTPVPMPEGNGVLLRWINRGNYSFFHMTTTAGECHLMLMEIAEKVSTRVLKPAADVDPTLVTNNLLITGTHILKKGNQICVAANGNVASWTIEADDTLSAPEMTPVYSSNPNVFPSVTFFDYDERYDSLIVGCHDGSVQSFGRDFTCTTRLAEIYAVFILSLTEKNEPTLIVSTSKGITEWSKSTGSMPLIVTPCVGYTRTGSRVIFKQSNLVCNPSLLHTIDLTEAGDVPYQHSYTGSTCIYTVVSTTTCLWTLIGHEMDAPKIEMRLGEHEIPLLADFIPSERLSVLFGSHDTLVMGTATGEYRVANFKKPKPTNESDQ